MSVAETKMIAAVVFAACSLLLLFYSVFLLGHTINILFFTPVDRATRPPYEVHVICFTLLLLPIIFIK